MTDDELTPEQVKAITAAVDIEAAPPEDKPVTLVLFGTNQAAPVRIAAERYHRGAAPLIIATGGTNRHNGIVEGREFARQLTEAGVPASAIRVEDTSANTWQNIELSLPYLREALNAGLPLVAVSKWYHLRTVYCLRTLLPEAAPFYAISWEPLYAGTLVTRENWPGIPDGRRRVVRESQEVPRRVAEGSYLHAEKKDGRWWLSLLPRVPTRSSALLVHQCGARIWSLQSRWQVLNPGSGFVGSYLLHGTVAAHGIRDEAEQLQRERRACPRRVRAAVRRRRPRQHAHMAGREAFAMSAGMQSARITTYARDLRRRLPAGTAAATPPSPRSTRNAGNCQGAET